MKHKFAFVAGVIILAGCATVTRMAPTSGSRSDGIVKLSFEYGEFDRIEIDEASALQSARQRCAVWGYTDADPFEGYTRQCQRGGGLFGGCSHWFVTKDYQCTMGRQAAMTQASALTPPPLVGPASTSADAGPHMVRAKTPSGYCLDVPPGYVGTGAANSPSVTAATPRCDQLSARPNR
jgi:hypothetical protein